MKIRIYLKNGQILPNIECEDFITEKSNITGDLISAKWVQAIIPRPVYIKIDDITAIVRIE